MLGIGYQFLCLGFGVVPIVLHTLGGLTEDGGENHGGSYIGDAYGHSRLQGSSGGNAPSLVFVRMLIGGVVASRSGLWLFDLAVTQLVQV